MHPQPVHLAHAAPAPLLSPQELAALFFDAPAPDWHCGDHALAAPTRPEADSPMHPVDGLLTPA